MGGSGDGCAVAQPLVGQRSNTGRTHRKLGPTVGSDRDGQGLFGEGGRLLEIHGIALGGRPLIAYHDHSGAAQMQRLLGLLAEGKSLAYASEAGTPLISDPGFELARAAVAAGLPISAASLETAASRR